MLDVGGADADAVASGLSPETTTVSVWPTSACATVYAWPVAPSMPERAMSRR